MILAAGSGSRLGTKHDGCPKQFLQYQGSHIFWHVAKIFARIPKISGIIFVLPTRFQPLLNPLPMSEQASCISSAQNCNEPHLDVEDLKARWHNELAAINRQDPLLLPWKVAIGGNERQHSVFNGLLELPAECQHVLVHDSARVFVTPALITNVLQKLEQGAVAVIPGITVTDTIKSVDAANLVTATYERAALRAVQTPQGFNRHLLQAAHLKSQQQNWQVTDDASLMEHCLHPVQIVPGEASNSKITTREDLALLNNDRNTTFTCTGFGYDVHRYGGTRPMILGGVPIATDITVDAHSDGDVVLHALIDGILGCLCQGDIGTLFPDNDEQYNGIASGILLSEVLLKAEQAKLVLCHADITIVAQVPRIAPHRDNIARNIAKLLSLPTERVNVKSTTEEHMGFTGEKKGIKAFAVVTAKRPT